MDVPLSCSTMGHRERLVSTGTVQYSGQGPAAVSSSLVYLALQQGYFGLSAGLHWHSHTTCSGTCCGFLESMQSRKGRDKAALPALKLPLYAVDCTICLRDNRK